MGAVLLLESFYLIQFRFPVHICLSFFSVMRKRLLCHIFIVKVALPPFVPRFCRKRVSFPALFLLTSANSASDRGQCSPTWRLWKAATCKPLPWDLGNKGQVPSKLQQDLRNVPDLKTASSSRITIIGHVFRSSATNGGLSIESLIGSPPPPFLDISSQR